MKRKLTFQLSEKEAFTMLHDFFSIKKNNKKIITFFLLLWLCICLVLITAFWSFGAVFNFHILLLFLFFISAIFGITISAIYALKRFYILPRLVRQFMRSDKQLCLKQTWIWDENAVALSSNKIKGSYPFRLFYNWQEFDNFFALFISAEKFYVLPKHAFDYEEPENGMSEQQLEDLRRIFTREITHK